MRASLRKFSLPVRKAGQRYTAAVIPGDGVGPELLQATESVLRASNVPVEFQSHNISEIGKRLEGFEEALDACRQHQLVFKGPLISDQSYDINKLQSTNYLFHKQLDISYFFKNNLSNFP